MNVILLVENRFLPLPLQIAEQHVFGNESVICEQTRDVVDGYSALVEFESQAFFCEWIKEVEHAWVTHNPMIGWTEITPDMYEDDSDES